MRQRWRQSVFLLTCLLLLAPSAGVLAQTPEGFAAQWDHVRGEYRSWLREYGVVGSSLVVLDRERVLAEEFAGQARLEKNQPVDRETIYHWASITKTMTAIAIMQLRDRGKLRLEDPIVQYLPELRAVHNPHGSMEAITLRHLLTHSAGLRNPTWPWGGDRPWHPFEPKEWFQLVAMLPYTEILFPPGSRFQYSNPGILFLGKVIEKVSGEDYEVYLDKNLFKPLEMYRSYFDTTPYHLLKHRAAGYYRERGTLRPAPFDPDTGITVSNGGLNAPLPDMVRYLQFLLGDRRRLEQYDLVLKRASLEEMLTAQLPLPPRSIPEQTGTNRRDNVGLSFLLEENAGFSLFGHYGEQAGFISQFQVCPATGTAYLVVFNTHCNPSAGEEGPGTTYRLSRLLKEQILAKLFPLFR
jgi:CubicO group peptidase (beta-lactamase class C family)